jgi:acetyl-CoA C-acetyltransferase
MPDAVIAAVARSPIGRAGKGSLVGVRPDDLTALTVRAALAKLKGLPPSRVEDLYVGTWEQSGPQSENLARRVAVQLGYDEMPGATMNRGCGSSLQAVRAAANAIRAGDGDVFVAAGVECVSTYPQLERDRNPLFDTACDRSRAVEHGQAEWTDPRASGLLPDVYIAMGQTAENVATVFGITRRDQDEFACASQQKAARAIAAGVFDREITPVGLPDGRLLATDDSPRPGTTVPLLAELQPAFRAGGTVTAGNSCPLNDGAAAAVVMSDVAARELGITPLARIVSFGVSGLSPELMGIGPVEATRRALARARLSLDDIDLVEINEAFAAQALASARELGVEADRLNVHGGSIALGHPFGMTGVRILATLINALQTRDLTYGLETMCIGGGQGMAMVIERLD